MKFIQSYPNETDAEKAYLQVIQIDLEAQDFDNAVANAWKFIITYPASPLLDIAHYKIGMAMTGSKKFKEAAEAFARVANDYPKSLVYPEALYGAAVNFDKLDQPKDAIPFYEKFVGGFPQHSLFKEAYARLGSLYLHAENFEKASGFYKDIFLNKKDVEADSKAAFWLVHYLLDKSDYDTMNKMLEGLPARFPKEDLAHEIYFFKGEVSMGLKQFKEAVLDYQKAIGTRPNGVYVPHSYLGIGVASVALNDLAAAESSFNEALRYDDETEVALRARFEIANLRLKTGNLLEAAKAFMMVPILYDDAKYCPLSLYKAGECFSKINKPEEAAKAFEELKSRYPDSEWAKKVSQPS